MITTVTIKNFKRLESVSVELGQNVILVGPNNSGKTSALQALALWRAGLEQWLTKKGDKPPKERTGVTLNRLELTQIPVSHTRLLFKDLRTHLGRGGESKSTRINIEIIVEGETGGEKWSCGLQFYFANPEAIYCRPIGEQQDDQLLIPIHARDVQVAFMQAMSGLASEEAEIQPGRINVLMGEGRTAEVIRNLCFKIYNQSKDDWESVKKIIFDLYGAQLDDPIRVEVRGAIEVTYREPRINRSLDLPASGRGMQQTLLIACHIMANPKTVLLLDEPDAHLEVLRQRRVYNVIRELAHRNGCQVISATHSEVLMSEAGEKDIIIAFVGRNPHRIDDRGAQVKKALTQIGFDQYYQADRTGWVIYLEGSTDLEILRAFAEKLEHPAMSVLAEPFVHYVANDLKAAQSHFYGLREAKPDLKGVAIFDRLNRSRDAINESSKHLRILEWRKREIENYLTTPVFYLGLHLMLIKLT